MPQNKESEEQPTVLPWHREAAGEIMLRCNDDWHVAEDTASIIARHDPHAETLRLLERALYCISLNDDTGHVIPAHVDMVSEIRAHLAAVKGSK